jgi:4-amino-4-deoxy-L-arabinose transferase-like glycosyltransferase
MQPTPMIDGRRRTGRRTELLRSPAVILVVAGLLRVAAWALGLAHPHSFGGGDTPDYWLLASDPLGTYGARDGLEFEVGLRRPPGYPVLLWIQLTLGGGWIGAALIQTGFGIAAVALTLELGRRLVGEAGAAVAAWWIALDPLHVIESSILLTEIPFSVALLLASLGAWKALVTPGPSVRWWAATGAMLGLATLVRPIAFYLPPLAALILALAGGRRLGARSAVLGAAIVLVAYAAVAGAWVARNQAASGVATISTIQGTNLAMYRAPGALHEGRNVPVAESRSRIAALVDARLPADANPARRAKVEERVGFGEILGEPIGYAISAGKGLFRTLFGPGGSHIAERVRGAPGAHVMGLALTLLSAASAVTASVLMLFGFGAALRRRAWLLLALVGLPVLYLLLVGSGHEAYSRFRLQMLPFVLIISAYACLAAVDAARRLGTR